MVQPFRRELAMAPSSVIFIMNAAFDCAARYQGERKQTESLSYAEK
jgi:hypothetical protein